MLSTIRESKYYKILVWIALLICIVFVFWWGSSIVTSPQWLRIDDYVEYWAAGQLNLNEGNPYDPAQLLPLQHEAGRYFGVPVMMWNPPWMLVIAMPFSIFEYSISRILWIIFFISIVFISANLIWNIYGGKVKTRWISWIITFSFVPLLQAFRSGQTGPLLLFGVVGFLFFIRKNKPLLAGVAISLLVIKPHILYLYIIAILAWCISEKQWRVILGVGISLIIASLVTLSLNTNVFHQYLYAIQNYPPEDWATPTLGGITRLLIGIKYFWLQFIPPILGIIWLLVFWFRNRNDWDWVELSPILILVSTLTSAYGWTFDQSASLVPILQVFILLIPMRISRTHVTVILTYLIIDILMVLPWGSQIWLWWLAPSLLVWYLVSRALIKNRLNLRK